MQHDQQGDEQEDDDQYGEEGDHNLEDGENNVRDANRKSIIHPIEKGYVSLSYN